MKRFYFMDGDRSKVEVGMDAFNVFIAILIVVGVIFFVVCLFSVPDFIVLLIPIATIFLINSYPAISFAITFIVVTFFRYTITSEKMAVTPMVIFVEIVWPAIYISAAFIGVAYFIGDMVSTSSSNDAPVLCGRTYC